MDSATENVGLEIFAIGGEAGGSARGQGTCLTHGDHWILDQQSQRGYRAHGIQSITLQGNQGSEEKRACPRLPGMSGQGPASNQSPASQPEHFPSMLRKVSALSGSGEKEGPLERWSGAPALFLR